MASNSISLILFRISLPTEPIKRYKEARKLINLHTSSKKIVKLESSEYIECCVPDGFAKLLVDGLLKLGINADVIKEGKL